ncbi:unnamed protein product, partial [Fusarium graminearum]
MPQLDGPAAIVDLKHGSLLLTEEPPVAMWAQRRHLVDRTDLVFELGAQKRIPETYMTLRLSQPRLSKF